MLDLHGPSGVLKWRILSEVGLIDDKWLRLLCRNAICGQFEEEEWDKDDGQEQDYDGYGQPAVWACWIMSQWNGMINYKQRWSS